MRRNFSCCLAIFAGLGLLPSTIHADSPRKDRDDELAAVDSKYVLIIYGQQGDLAAALTLAHLMAKECDKANIPWFQADLRTQTMTNDHVGYRQTPLDQSLTPPWFLKEISGNLVVQAFGRKNGRTVRLKKVAIGELHRYTNTDEMAYFLEVVKQAPPGEWMYASDIPDGYKRGEINPSIKQTLTFATAIPAQLVVPPKTNQPGTARVSDAPKENTDTHIEEVVSKRIHVLISLGADSGTDGNGHLMPQLWLDSIIALSTDTGLPCTGQNIRGPSDSSEFAPRWLRTRFAQLLERGHPVVAAYGSLNGKTVRHHRIMIAGYGGVNASGPNEDIRLGLLAASTPPKLVEVNTNESHRSPTNTQITDAASIAVEPVRIGAQPPSALMVENDEPSVSKSLSKVEDSFLNAWKNYGLLGVLFCLVGTVLALIWMVVSCLVLVSLVMAMLGLGATDEGFVAAILGSLFLKKR